MRTITAYAPASIGNFIAGFDALGCALAPVDGSLWGDRVILCEAETDAFECEGRFAHRLPRCHSDNLVLKAKTVFEEALGRRLPPVAIRLQKYLPVSSGLGSSSSSLVAALVAFNAWEKNPITINDLLGLAGRVECMGSGSVHYDNVAPCLLGGLRIVAHDARTQALPFPENLLLVVAESGLELSTRQSRGVLPATIPLSRAVEYGQNLAAFVHAIHIKDSELLRETFHDLVAEPYRADLVKGFRKIQSASLDAGALGCSFAGSGPAIFAVAESTVAPVVAEAMKKAFTESGVPFRVCVCRLDMQGARLLCD